jgi:hypothetical protein
MRGKYMAKYTEQDYIQNAHDLLRKLLGSKATFEITVTVLTEFLEEGDVGGMIAGYALGTGEFTIEDMQGRIDIIAKKCKPVDLVLKHFSNIETS